MLHDGINDLIPQSGISDPVTQALHHQEFRPRYGPGCGTAMRRRHQRVIAPWMTRAGAVTDASLWVRLPDARMAANWRIKPKG